MKELGKYAKNYLPLLFNLYTTEKWQKGRDPVRQSVLETIKRYLSVTDLSLCYGFFDRSVEKMQNLDGDQQVLYVVLRSKFEKHFHCDNYIQSLSLGYYFGISSIHRR